MHTQTRLIAFLVPVVLASAAPAAAQTAPPRACTPADLSGTRTPAIVETDKTDSRSAATLAAGRRYRVTIVSEQAISNDRDRRTGLRENSVAVSSPSGLAFTPRQDADSGRQVFVFTAPATDQTLHIDVTYVLDIGSPVSDACTASAAFDLPVRIPKLISTTAKFIGSQNRSETRFPGYYLTFALPAAQGRDETEARDQRPVTVLIRMRTGTTKAPMPVGKATYSLTYRYTSDGRFIEVRTAAPNFVRRFASNFEWDSSGVTISCNPNAPRSGLRYALSVEVRQAGRRVGGMRGGGVCKSERYLRSDGARRTRPRIIRSNFAAKP